MKRFLSLSISLFLLSCLAVHATDKKRQKWNDQPFKYEVRLGWGMPSEAVDYVIDDVYSGLYDDVGYLSSMYGPQAGSMYSTGGITGEFNMNFRKWFSLSLSASFNGLWKDNYDSYTLQKVKRDRGLIFNIIPQLRFNWVSRPAFKMYTSLGIGMNIQSFAGRTEVWEAVQFVPFGMAIGRQFFFFWEAGLGNCSNFTGLNAGFGYRF